LWKNFKDLFDKKAGLNPKFSFNQIAFEIHNLLGKGKTVAASTIRNFYFRTTPRKKTIEAIQRWIDEAKKKNVNHADVENESKEIDNSDDNIVINNRNSKEDNES